MTDRRRHKLLRVIYKLWIIPAVMVAMQVACWVLERTPPIVIKDYVVNDAPQGGPVVLSISVKRDLTRRCSVTLTRVFFDAVGTRHHIVTQHHNTLASAMNEKLMPGRLTIGFDIPSAAARGAGHLVTTAEYTCNPLHTVWPIPLEMSQKIEVL